MRHALQNLVADDVIVLPASATVIVQAAEIRNQDVCGVDMTPVNQYRWHPSHLAGAHTLTSHNRKKEVQIAAIHL